MVLILSFFILFLNVHIKFHYISSGKEAFAILRDKYNCSKNPMSKRFSNIDQSIPVWFVFGKNSWVRATDGFLAASKRPKTFVKVFQIQFFLNIRIFF
jgi:hypothetical protein